MLFIRSRFAKSFLTFLPARKSTLCWLVVLAMLGASLAGGRAKPREREDLINIFLGPELAQWLVGPIARIATDEEVTGFLALTDDTAADSYIDEFWRQRVDRANPWPGRQARDVFEERAKEADQRFSEGASLGRATDRGELFVLYGAPTKQGFAQDRGRRRTTVEIWLYSRKSPPGLDGAQPPLQAFFIKEGDRTVRFQPRRAPELIRGIRVP